MRRSLALLLILSLAHCAGGKKPPPAPEHPPVATPPAAVSPVPAPSVPVPEALLAGGWGREIRTGVAGREGFELDPDGRLGLIGILSMEGVSWRLENDSLVLLTSTERYPEAQRSVLRVEELTPTRLVLSGEGYLAGTWERSEFRSVTGTVTYRQRIALTPEAVVQVELRDVSRGNGQAPLLARQIIRRPGQVPIAFVLDYDPASIEAGHSCALSARIADRGQLQFVTETPVAVSTDAAAGPAEIVVVPVR